MPVAHVSSIVSDGIERSAVGAASFILQDIASVQLTSTYGLHAMSISVQIATSGFRQCRTI